MEQFVFVSTSVYNKSFNTQSVTNQEFQKYQPLQNPMYQIDSVKKEIKQKTICKTRLFSRQNFLLSTYQALDFTNLDFDGVETGLFLSDFAQQLRRKNKDVPGVYFTWRRGYMSDIDSESEGQS